jgi:hypothetical protein
MPFALGIGESGSVWLMSYNYVHYFYRKPDISALAWVPPVVATNNEGNMESGDDLMAVAGDASLGAVYHVFARQLRNYQNTIRFTRSLDNGTTWSVPAVLSSPNCNGSSMVVGADGTLYVTWVDYALGQVLLRKSTDHGATFSPPGAVADMFDNLNAWAAGWRPTVGERFYPYYREGVPSRVSAPNFPALAIDRSNGPTRGWLYLTWADCAEGTPTLAPTTVYDTEPNNSIAGAQSVPLDCEIGGYSDNCCDATVQDVDYYTFDGVAGETIVFDGTCSSSSTHGFGLYELLPTGERLPLASVPLPGSVALAAGAHGKPAIITLPRTGRYLISLGGGADGWSYTLRLRRLNIAPTSLARDMRDIVLVRSTDGGATWSPKARVNHDGPGADQHQPNVAVDGQGRIYVAWYDGRGTLLGNTVNAYASVSTDGGTTFGPDLKLSSVASEWIRPSSEQFPDWTFPGNMIGDRIALTAGDDYGMAAWTDLRNFPVASVYGARIVDIPTAVLAVSDLTAEPLAEGVHLRWRVNDSRGLSAIEVLRAGESTPEAVLGSVPNAGIEGELEYLDATAGPGRRYAYRLAVRVGGTTQYLGPVSVETLARIDALAWRAAGPNPFDRQTAVELAVPRSETGVVRVYDIQGKIVRTLRDGRFEAGVQRLEWDGRDASGADSPPGLYFVAAQVGPESTRTKLTRIR